MKRIMIFLVTFVLCISFCIYTNAYTTDKFSIDIPEEYKSTSEGIFAKSDGTNIYVKSKPYKYKNENIYTEKFLDEFEKSFKTEIEAKLEETKQSLKEQYKSYFSEKQINDIITTIKFDTIDTRELTKITKNNYKCFHILSTCSINNQKLYTNQYLIYSKTDIYAISISSTEKESFESEEIKKILDSFTINNYEEPIPSFPTKYIVIAVGAVIGAVVGTVFSLKNKQKKA